MSRLIKEINYMKSMMGLVIEEIDPSEAYTDKGALDTVIKGKRNIASLVNPSYLMRYLIKKNGLKLIKIEKNKDNLYLVYRPGSEEQVKELLSIADKYGGYFSYQASKEETNRIGQLLGYSQDKIDKYVKQRYT